MEFGPQVQAAAGFEADDSSRGYVDPRVRREYGGTEQMMTASRPKRQPTNDDRWWLRGPKT